MYTMIACDLDGTLLNDHMQLSKPNSRAMQAIADMGVLFVPSSGRTMCEIPDEVKQHPAVRYLIYANGCAIYDKATDERIVIGLSNEQVNAVLDIVSPYQPNITFRWNGQSYVDINAWDSEEKIARNRVWDYHNIVIHQHAIFLDNFDDFCRGCSDLETFAISFCNDEIEATCLEQLSRLSDIRIVAAAPHLWEIFSEKAGKGNTLKLFAEMHNIDMAHVISIGDSGNDITGVKAAGLGLATSNACDELKAVADAVICSNEEHVAPYVLTHYLEEV